MHSHIYYTSYLHLDKKYHQEISTKEIERVVSFAFTQKDCFSANEVFLEEKKM